VACWWLGETDLQAKPAAEWLDKHVCDERQWRSEGCGGVAELYGWGTTGNGADLGGE